MRRKLEATHNAVADQEKHAALSQGDRHDQPQLGRPVELSPKRHRDRGQLTREVDRPRGALFFEVEAGDAALSRRDEDLRLVRHDHLGIG